MRVVQYSYESPEDTVALDEVLLDKAEHGGIGETLRFWEADEHFIVVGRAGKIGEDCFEPECRSGKIKIIRRVSGGGAVLQGPGCLNFSLILSYKRDERYKSIKGSYLCILNDISASFQKAGHNVEFFPISDLALSGKKISGNAEARKREFFLHHGTFLYDFDLTRVGKYLKHPRQEPEYRDKRPHKNFLTNIPISACSLRETIKTVFAVTEGEYCLSKEDIDRTRELVLSKYSKDEWNYVF